MSYDPKKVAELIADRRTEELEKALQPRLRKIAEIVSKVKYGLDIKDTVGHDFAFYISSGAYSNKEEVSFGYFADSKGRLGLSYSVSYEDDGSYPVDYDITMPVEFATCEDKDLKEVVITQIRDDLYRYVDKLEKEFNKARNIRNKFTIEYDRFINTNEENEAKEGEV